MSEHDNVMLRIPKAPPPPEWFIEVESRRPKRWVDYVSPRRKRDGTEPSRWWSTGVFTCYGAEPSIPEDRRHLAYCGLALREQPERHRGCPANAWLMREHDPGDEDPR